MVIIEEEDFVKVGFGRVRERSERLRVLWAFQSAVLEGRGREKIKKMITKDEKREQKKKPFFTSV